MQLKNLEQGVTAYVLRIDTGGEIKSRLLELGLTEGAKIECVGRSPAGNPAAYRIRGAVVAIRDTDAAGIFVEVVDNGVLTIALAGNPNVGKSTVFNGLTGMKQHTGNWAGKTVGNTWGICRCGGRNYRIVDVPGTYSLQGAMAEEKTAGELICSGDADAVLVVCDATCLERNLNLVLQVIETGLRTLVLVNLMDEAVRKGILIDREELEKQLGVPVLAVCAKKRDNIRRIREFLSGQMDSVCERKGRSVEYSEKIEAAIRQIENRETEGGKNKFPSARWRAIEALWMEGEEWREQIAKCRMDTAEKIHKHAVTLSSICPDQKDRKLDKILTGKWSGYPIMVLFLILVLYLTIVGANYPSELLAKGFYWIQGRLMELAVYLHVPDWLRGLLIDGIYRVLTWVIAVMLPPMAIFFPLFTLLEDAGYLPRIAYNLDKTCQKCHACGKQALTMVMGFGCNAVGVTGCRIIDSPKERMIAILTNNFVPCNGRFPTLITILMIFLIGGYNTNGRSAFLAALFLAGMILFGITMAFLVSHLLSVTVLKGLPSAFVLELPPYRRPEPGRVIVRSVFDRILFVLGRAVAVAAPAGAIIWLLANITVGEHTLLRNLSLLLDPFARQIGLDGAILLAFILGFPANEIVMPITVMIYMEQGSLIETGSLAELKLLLEANGWTTVTAVCVMLFSLMHWPCSTTMLTIKKETGSIRFTLLAFLIPSLVGIFWCFLISHMALFT